MSNQYLTIISVGPVQGFIASARRSRDLWSGSWLLSELAKSCAKYLHEQGAELIFPYVEKEEWLKENSEFSVGNKIQAIITADSPEQLQAVIKEAKQAINQRFVNEVNRAFDNLSDKADIRQNIWDNQKDDYVEIQSAWANIDNTQDNGYGEAVALASKLLASRKATRDFSASCINPYDEDFMLPKSSLDGVRETVLLEDKKLKNKTRAKLSLAKSEQLDCVGVVKRLGFDSKVEQFTPLTRVATESWINKVLQNDNNALKKIRNIYKKLVNYSEFGYGIVTKVTGNDGIYSSFPFDAQFLYQSRIVVGINEWKDSDNVFSGLLEELQKELHPIWKTYGQPQSYGVMLLADGDKMGELLDKAKTKADHQQITKALSNFAESVRSEMQASQGHCIYAGGDDVLGIVPLDKAYECADNLQQKFSESLSFVSENLGANTPTLSVGLAICHQMTPFAVIRDLAKQAEKHAKGDHCEPEDRRNALGIVLSIRSGTDTKLRLRWDDKQAHDRFDNWIKHYIDKTLPSRVAYDIRDIHLRTQAIAQDATDKNLHTKIQSAELERMLKQSRTADGKKLEKDDITDLKQRGEKIGLASLADELIVARWFASKTAKDLGRV